MVVGSSVFALGSSIALGMTVMTVSHRLMHLPGPGWGLRPSHDIILMMSAVAGIATGAAVIPVWRKAVGWLWRATVGDVDGLAERLATKIRQSIDEEKRNA
jgi:hypothetical protein